MAELSHSFPRKSIGLLVVLLAGSLSVAQTASSLGRLDPDGKPLPFGSFEEVEEFLRTAEIVSSKRVGEGMNNPLEVLLEKDGIRMHALFRDVHVERSLWEKLQALDETEVRERLEKFLNPFELNGLIERKGLLIDHIQKLIDERGEKDVLFTMR